MDNKLEKLVYSKKEVAQVLGIGLPKVTELVNTVGFPCIRLERRILIPKVALEKWLEEQAKKTA